MFVGIFLKAGLPYMPYLVYSESQIKRVQALGRAYFGFSQAAYVDGLGHLSKGSAEFGSRCYSSKYEPQHEFTFFIV